eukprot:3039281-Pyramimonas_sp.AAC.1
MSAKFCLVMTISRATRLPCWVFAKARFAGVDRQSARECSSFEMAPHSAHDLSPLSAAVAALASSAKDVV